MLEGKKLTCPECGEISETYKDHFAHWSSHYTSIVAEEGEVVPLNHDQAIRFYKKYPGEIEVGFRVVASEVGIFRGRIDIVGFDKDGNLTVVDVTLGKDTKRKAQQLSTYRHNLKWMARYIFGLKDAQEMKIRLLLIGPGREVREI